CGSEQTLSTLGSTSSIDQSERSTACASSFPHRNVPAIATAETHTLARSHLPSAEHLFSSNCGCVGTRNSGERPAALSSCVQDSCFPLGSPPRACLRAFVVFRAGRRHWRAPANRRICPRCST